MCAGDWGEGVFGIIGTCETHAGSLSQLPAEMPDTDSNSSEDHSSSNLTSKAALRGGGRGASVKGRVQTFKKD